MSIAVLTDVYTETRRLAVAGSVVAPGDFRLKKLIAPLQKSGEKAPVFTKVAEAVQRVVDSNEQTSAEAILNLGSLVCSILYTQGATGADGELNPIESSTFALTFSNGRTFLTARVIKPLLKALSTSGSGRFDLIRAAHERNYFTDLRLIRPALAAIDDGYREVGDYVADSILPIYGKAILQELKGSLDLKGKQGHARRLRLIHRLEPQQSKELIKKALEEGSKEVKIAAIECLGDSPEELSFLLEQSKARSQDVRAAALLALSRWDTPDIHSLLVKTLQGKDLALLVRVVEVNRNIVLVEHARTLASEQLPLLVKQKDKSKQQDEVNRLMLLLRIASAVKSPQTEACLISILRQIDILGQIKSDPGGEDIAMLAVELLAAGSDAAVNFLIQNRDTLPADSFGTIFNAARRVLDPSSIFDTFSSFLKPLAKKSAAGTTRFRRLHECLIGNRRYFAVLGELPETNSDLPDFDPRWVELAIELELPGIVYANPIVGHRPTHDYLTKQWNQATSKKTAYDAPAIALTMLQCQHPDAESLIVARIAEMAKRKSDYETNQWCHLASSLPASSLPQLESIYANDKTPAAFSKALLDSIQIIRNWASTTQVNQ